MSFAVRAGLLGSWQTFRTRTSVKSDECFKELGDLGGGFRAGRWGLNGGPWSPREASKPHQFSLSSFSANRPPLPDSLMLVGWGEVLFRYPQFSPL